MAHSGERSAERHPGGVFVPRTPTVLFVCTANIVRSPLATALLGHHLLSPAPEALDLHSAGTRARSGRPVEPEVKDVALRRGLDLSRHQSRRLDAVMVANADLVLTMTEAHRSEIQLLLPAALSRTFTLREFIRLSASAPARGPATAAHQAHHARPFISAGSGPEDIADPIGGPLSQFEQLAEELDHLTRAVAARLSVDTQEND